MSIDQDLILQILWKSPFDATAIPIGLSLVVRSPYFLDAIHKTERSNPSTKERLDMLMLTFYGKAQEIQQKSHQVPLVPH